MSKFNVEKKANEILTKVANIIEGTSIFPSEELYNKALINLSFIILDELIEASKDGYEYDSEFEIPFYEAVKEQIKNTFNNSKLIEII